MVSVVLGPKVRQHIMAEYVGSRGRKRGKSGSLVSQRLHISRLPLPDSTRLGTQP